MKYEVRTFGTTTTGATLWGVWDTWNGKWCWLRVDGVRHGSSLDRGVARANADRMNEPYANYVA